MIWAGSFSVAVKTPENSTFPALVPASKDACGVHGSALRWIVTGKCVHILGFEHDCQMIGCARIKLQIVETKQSVPRGAARFDIDTELAAFARQRDAASRPESVLPHAERSRSAFWMPFTANRQFKKAPRMMFARRRTCITRP
jgi:hypothetical protein